MDGQTQREYKMFKTLFLKLKRQNHKNKTKNRHFTSFTEFSAVKIQYKETRLCLIAVIRLL